MNSRVFCGEPGQGYAESDPCLEIRRTLPPRAGMDEVGGGHRPRRLEQCRHLGEEGGCQPGDWISLLCQPLQQSAEQASLLRGDAHALAINGIESADYVGEWQKAARERLKALEMAEHALRKAVARDSAQRLGVPDCVVDRRRPQFASER